MSFPEIIFFAVLGLLVFGPKRLPEIARVVGKTMTELRRASNEFKQSLEDEIHNLETPPEPEAHRDLLPESIEPYTGRDLDPAWGSELDSDLTEETDEEDALAEAEWSREDDAALEEEFLADEAGEWREEAEAETPAEPTEPVKPSDAAQPSASSGAERPEAAKAPDASTAAAAVPNAEPTAAGPRHPAGADSKETTHP